MEFTCHRLFCRPVVDLTTAERGNPHILYRIQHGVGVLAVCDNGGLVDGGIAANG